MKCCLLISLVFFIIVVNSGTRINLLLPQLPLGKYRLNFISIIPRCISIQSKNKILFDLYLSKKSAIIAEIKGNITNLIPVDDSLNLEFNLAIKDSTGDWKENAHVHKSTKSCSSLKMFFGNAWTPIMDNLGFLNATCPIPAGFYKMKGVDSELFNISNFPKTFFYGTYRFRFYYTKNNEVYGCFMIVIEIKRPWETDN
ncbi:uncharacterized protein LOC111036316 [Myzus persicae]|uniref:uncharacterized protein LOC111036316 n=1 Tax=Myzus persicae TaxID=13164 RepID=UPI000B939C32|nr:uncharacterized protein LOC111036316 [Myzus persicae]